MKAQGRQVDAADRLGRLSLVIVVLNRPPLCTYNSYYIRYMNNGVSARRTVT